jgi:hypothetical protein
LPACNSEIELATIWNIYHWIRNLLKNTKNSSKASF